MIKRAAVDLRDKLLSFCPQCSRPGFTMTGHTSGLPCRSCGHPTQMAKSFRWTCASCLYARVVDHSERYAQPDRCDTCNP